MAVIYAEPFASMPAVWENTTSPYTTPRDASYPFVLEVLRTDLVSGVGASGENVAHMNTIAGYVAFDDYGPWDATCGSLRADIRFDSSLAGSLSSGAFTKFLVLKSSNDISGTGNINLQIRRTSIAGSVLTADLRLLYNNLSATSPISITVDLDQWFCWKIAWQCGSNPVETLPGPGVPTANSDGEIIVTRQPLPSGSITTLISLTGIPLYVSPGTSWGGTFSALNFNNDAQIGAVGDFTNVTLESCEEEEPEPPDPVPGGPTNNSVPTCCQTAGPGETSAGPVLPPVSFESIIVCGFGGQAPDTTPITNSENWAV